MPGKPKRKVHPKPKKLGRPKKEKEPNYKVPFKVLQEIKFEVYSPYDIGQKITFEEKDHYYSRSVTKRSGIVIGAIISSKTKEIKTYLIGTGLAYGRAQVIGPNEYVKEKYLNNPKNKWEGRELKRGGMALVFSKDIKKNGKRGR